MEGGKTLAEIYFSNKEEALSFCDFLFAQKDEVSVQWHYHKKWGHVVLVNENKEKEERVVRGLIHVYVIHRERSWLIDIIRNCYYFSDDDEVAHIYELCCSFRDEPDHWGEDHPSSYRHSQQLERLRHVFKEALEKGEGFAFDSIITFRFQRFYDELIEVVGEAIDEYKREQDYQTYIQHLREYLQANPSKVERLSIVQSQPFIFYSHKGRRYTSDEIKKLTADHPLYLFGLGTDELDLTPIMALAPDRIEIYGNDPSDPKTLTVMNIFQERAEFLPLTKFPFKRLSPF